MKQAVRRVIGISIASVVVAFGAGCGADTAISADATSADTPSASPSVNKSPDGDRTKDRERRKVEDRKPRNTQQRATESPKKQAAPNQQARRGAAGVLDRLTVKGRAPLTGYHRDRFGPAWLDADRNGCDTRNDILGAYLSTISYESGTNQCRVLSGNLADPYTAQRLHFVYGDGALVDIDHVAALGNAWVTGAFQWDIDKRAAFANDPVNLLPVDAGENRSKGDGDAATWLPPDKAFRCAYVARQITVKHKYQLWVTPPEKAAMHSILGTCPGQPMVKDSGAPTRVDHNITDPGPERPTRSPEPRPQSAKPPQRNSGGECAPGYDPCVPPYPPDVNCADVDGPISVTGDDPHGLDGEGDGIACE